MGAGGGRTGELYSLGKPDRGKVGDRFVDFPCEAVGGTVVLYLEAVIPLIPVAAEVGHISILLILQFLPANGETKQYPPQWNPYQQRRGLYVGLS